MFIQFFNFVIYLQQFDLFAWGSLPEAVRITAINFLKNTVVTGPVAQPGGFIIAENKVPVVSVAILKKILNAAHHFKLFTTINTCTTNPKDTHIFFHLFCNWPGLFRKCQPIINGVATGTDQTIRFLCFKDKLFLAI